MWALLVVQKHRLLLREAKTPYRQKAISSYIIATMESLYSDTHPQIEALQIQLWRQAAPTRKMEMVAQLNKSARTLALTGLRDQFPQASEAELHFKLAVILLGEETARKVYGDDFRAK